MEAHSSVLAWEVPWTEEAGGLQSIASQSLMWQSNWAQRSIPTVYTFLTFPILSKNFTLTLHSVLSYLLMFILV